jgi:4-coumarate--CoA ligase
MSRGSYDSKLKIWSGPKKEIIYNSEVSLGYLILSVLEQTPEMITQVSADSNLEISCREMKLRSMKIASHLMRVGLIQGDVVGIVATNSDNLTPVMFACFTLGLPINTLAPVMIESDIIQMYSKTKPKIIFCDSDIIGTVQNTVDRMDLDASIYTLVEKVEGYQFVDDILNEDFNEEDFK